MNTLIFLGIFLVIYLLWTITIHLGLKQIRCSRAFTKTALFEGESCELIEVVVNDQLWFIPWLRLESRISRYLQLDNKENLEVSDESYYHSLFVLPPYIRIRRRHKVKFTHRGVYDLGNASLTVGDLLGLYESQRQQMLSAPIYVYPRLLEEDELPVSLTRMTGEMVQKRQLLADPFLVRGIRPYQAGDPVRDIHWPATARTQDVQVRLHDYTTQTKLLVVLNCQREDLQWNDFFPEGDAPISEYAISLAASVCIQALRAGLAAGFAANMPMEEGRSGTTLILPAEGTVQEEKLLSACAKLHVVRSMKFPAFLESLEAHSGLDILIISRYDSEAIQQHMETLRRRGNQVKLHLIERGGQ